MELFYNLMQRGCWNSYGSFNFRKLVYLVEERAGELNWDILLFLAG